MRCAALTFPGVNQIAIGEVELPDLGARDVLIRTEYSFVSTGTERWTLEGRMGRRQDGTSFPLVPGYQKVGRVEAVGPEVTRFEPGQRVFMTSGRIRSGGSAQWGGHMQYSLESESEVYALPEELPSTAAAALVVVQVGWNNAQRPSLSPGDLALVIGDGVIGQFTAQGLRARGAEVWLAGRHRMRLDLGLQWSADRVLDVGEEDLFEAARSARPDGMDIVVETVCRPDDTPLYLSMLRRQGQLVFAAYHPESNWVDMAPAQDKEITALQGVNVNRYSALGFGIGAGLTGLAGALLVTVLAVNSGIGTSVSIKAFIMVMLGGAGVVSGAIIGAFVLGLSEAIGYAYIPGSMTYLLIFVGLILFLILRPQGIMGKPWG